MALSAAARSATDGDGAYIGVIKPDANKSSYPGSDDKGIGWRAKGGVRLLAKSVALEHAADNIRCNSVHPGIIATPIWEKIPTGAEGNRRNAPIDPRERADATRGGASAALVECIDIVPTVLDALGRNVSVVTCLSNPWDWSGDAFYQPVTVYVDNWGYASVPADVTWSYADLWSSATTWGGDLDNKPRAGDSVVIYAETQREWMLVAQAASAQGRTIRAQRASTRPSSRAATAKEKVIEKPT